MAQTLIIAEKPSVAGDIAKVLGVTNKTASAYENDEFVIAWSVGHLLQFVPPEGYDDNLKRWRLKDLPILPDKFLLEPVRGQSKQLNALTKLLKRKTVNLVVNGCDAGREGELIFWEIYRHSGSSTPVKRLWLQSMTTDAIKKGMKNLKEVAVVQGLADAADCRAESDWLIGMNATRALTVRLRTRSKQNRLVWSAGRVQTPTLAMLVKRERAILAHVPKDYWTISGEFRTQGAEAHTYTGIWFDPRGEAPKDRIFASEERDRILALLAGDSQPMATETRKDKLQAAPPLFDLTSLQREANRRNGLSARHTLRAAQALYESYKLVTYPRTASRALPSDYRDHVKKAFGFLAGHPDYAPHAQRMLDKGMDGLSNTDRNFDDAAVTDHFAIIPTGQGDASKLSGAEAKIFDLICRRFLAAFHPVSVTTSVQRITKLKSESFRSSANVLKVPGWQAVWQREAAGAQGKDEPKLPPLAGPEDSAAGVPVTLVDGTAESQHKETKPPARFTEANLLGLMETAGKELDDERLAQRLKDVGGLGTPATRADIIETLLAREYAGRCTSVDRKKGLRATPKGLRLVEALERIKLPRLTSPELTAALEEELFGMQSGIAKRADYMKRIRAWTEELIGRIRDFSYDELYADTPDVGKCPSCEAAVRETLRNYTCARGGVDGECEFVVWKDMSGRYVDRGTAETLVATGKTSFKSGFFSRDGREYEASLAIEEGRVVIKPKGDVGPDPPPKPVEPADLGPCPFCQKMVRRSEKGYRCDGYGSKAKAKTKTKTKGKGGGKQKAKDKGCSLNLPLSPCKRELSLEEVKQLIGEERKTGLLEGFTSRKGQPFSAILNLTDEGRIKWEFPPRSGGKGAAPVLKEFPVQEGALVKKCPKCKGAEIVETATHFACVSADCAVGVPRMVCERELTRDEITPLFEAGETPLLEGFISKKGKPFNATLYLKRTGRHGFRFESR